MRNKMLEQNRHWQHGSFVVPNKKRAIFDEVLRNIDVDPMLLITGSRRVGKSVLLKQLINHLIEVKKIVPEQILFYEFSPSQTVKDLREVVELYRNEYADNTERRYVFLDEIQYLDGYEEYIKLIYDADKTKLKLFLTGSLSLNYKSKVQDSLAGRYFEHQVFPLFFDEYLYLVEHPMYERFVQVRANPSQAKVRGLVDQLGGVFGEFLYYYRLPETVGYDHQKAMMYIQTVKLQSLNMDALNYFEIKNPQVLNALYEEIIKHNGDELSLRSLARKGLETTQTTLSKYLRVLQAMSLVYVVSNTDQPIKKTRGLRKVYTSSYFCSKERNIGYLVESYVLERLLTRGEDVSFFRQREREVDFVLPRSKKAIEVKYRSQLKAESVSFVREFCQKRGFDLQIVSLKDFGENVMPAMLF